MLPDIVLALGRKLGLTVDKNIPSFMEFAF